MKGTIYILIGMSKRLQVILDDKEMRDVQRIAKRQQMTVSEWVRQALRAAQRQVPLTDSNKKLGVVRAAARHDFPTGDVDQMLRDSLNQQEKISPQSLLAELRQRGLRTPKELVTIVRKDRDGREGH